MNCIILRNTRLSLLIRILIQKRQSPSISLISFSSSHTAIRIPCRNGLLHIIIPCKNIFCLIIHCPDFPFTERNRLGKRTESIATHIKSKQPPKFNRYFIVKISIYDSRCKDRCFLGRKYNAIKFLPEIPEIISVKVNDYNLPLFHHHISFNIN